MQAACTPKELKELLGTCGLATHIPPPGMAVTDEDQVTLPFRDLPLLLGTATQPQIVGAATWC